MLHATQTSFRVAALAAIALFEAHAQEPPTGEPRLPAGVATDTVCAEEFPNACWIEVENLPGCYLWTRYWGYYPSLVPFWSGECTDGLTDGWGSAMWVDGDNPEFLLTVESGAYRNGRKHGEWIIVYDDGRRNLIHFVDGSPHGGSIERIRKGDRAVEPLVYGVVGSLEESIRHLPLRGYADPWPDGGVAEGSYVDGRRDGQWTFRFANGDRSEGLYVDGARNGDWRIQYADGDVAEGPYIDGERNGRWTIRTTDGTVIEAPYVNGVIHGTQLTRWPDGRVSETLYIDGEAQQ